MAAKNPVAAITMWALLALVMMASAAVYWVQHTSSSRSTLPVLATLPEFEFVDQSGQPFNRAAMEGKISLVDFIFTGCRMACPAMSGKMKEFYTAFAAAENLQFVSISVDPANDTLEALNEYAKRFGVMDDRWVFLRAPLSEVQHLSEQGFHLGGDFPANHSTKFVLVDEQGRIRGYYDSFDNVSMGTLASHMRQLLRERQ